jgi:hypothetical protein
LRRPLRAPAPEPASVRCQMSPPRVKRFNRGCTDPLNATRNRDIAHSAVFGSRLDDGSTSSGRVIARSELQRSLLVCVARQLNITLFDTRSQRRQKRGNFGPASSRSTNRFTTISTSGRDFAECVPTFRWFNIFRGGISKRSMPLMPDHSLTSLMSSGARARYSRTRNQPSGMRRSCGRKRPL